MVDHSTKQIDLLNSRMKRFADKPGSTASSQYNQFLHEHNDVKSSSFRVLPLDTRYNEKMTRVMLIYEPLKK